MNIKSIYGSLVYFAWEYSREFSTNSFYTNFELESFNLYCLTSINIFWLRFGSLASIIVNWLELYFRCHQFKTNIKIHSTADSNVNTFLSIAKSAWSTQIMQILNHRITMKMETIKINQQRQQKTHETNNGTRNHLPRVFRVSLEFFHRNREPLWKFEWRQLAERQ